MGSESTSLPEEKPHNPDPEPIKTMEGDGQVAQGDNTRDASPISVFVNSEPMKEEQVQNAVKFLSHPKVKGSPVMYRRSFLEKKGLTREEIDEAFRRVPDPPPSVTSTQAANPSQDSQAVSTANMQPKAPAQSPQPAAAASIGIVSRVANLRPTSFHWSQALFAIGFLAASGAGTAVLFKNLVVPKLKSWIRKVVLEGEDGSVKQIILKPSPSEEVAAASTAASDVVKASQQMLNSINEERRYFEAIMSKLNVQVEEVKSMSSAIRKLEVKPSSRNEPNNSSWKTPLVDEEDPRLSRTGSKQMRTNGMEDFDLVSVRPSSAPASVEPSVAPHPKSYMEIMAMVQRGEKPPGIKEINDLPPNPNQPPSNPRLAPRVKPWDVTQQNGSYYGEDKVPNSQLNGVSSELWWQQKNAKITEIEPEDEFRTASYRAGTNERIQQRAWVPPQPPPIAMAEAAAAIRQPKSLVQKERPIDDEMIAHPSDDLDELQRITKISESGGEVGINGMSAEPRFTEIEEAQEY